MKTHIEQVEQNSKAKSYPADIVAVGIMHFMCIDACHIKLKIYSITYKENS